MPTKLIKYNKYKHKKSKWVDPIYVDFAILQINLNTYNDILKRTKIQNSFLAFSDMVITLYQIGWI